MDTRYTFTMEIVKMAKQAAVFLAGFCVFALCFSCTNNADELQDYVNDHVVAAEFGDVAIADAAEWGPGDPQVLGDMVSQLRFLSAERGRLAIMPKSEREQRWGGGCFFTRS
jgi:hypothetical protein